MNCYVPVKVGMRWTCLTILWGVRVAAARGAASREGGDECRRCNSDGVVLVHDALPFCLAD
ncbi:MAG: hypothetical protein IIU60_02710, partial [Paraprevotella sp.]|nr:hypothetical protein [Paraprevotella sp.]